MNVGQVFKADTSNGIGTRVSVFVSGCLNHCPGCFQPQTWDFNYGVPYTQTMEDGILEELAKPQYRGLTILGGEPFEIANQPEVAQLVRRVKKELPKKTIWIYTGYLVDRDLIPGGCRYTEFTDEILDGLEVLVDGRFEQDKHQIGLRFRGSWNQRIIDMKRTRATGEIVISHYAVNPDK